MCILFESITLQSLSDIQRHRDTLYSTRFNSFTQQLCIDNAVKVGAQPATEADLHPVANGSSSNGPSSTTQEVTWTAKFVDRVSEVTDNLNISGKSFTSFIVCVA